jgi:hypothetical protein
MKKVSALSFVFALLAITAAAQNPKTEHFRKQRMEQRMLHRGPQFRQPGAMPHRQQILQHQLMRQKIMRHRIAMQKRAVVGRKMQMQQRRKMMLRRQLMYRRVI